MSRRFIGGMQLFDEETTTSELARALPTCGIATWPLAELVIDDEHGCVRLRLRSGSFRSRFFQALGFPRWDWEAPLDSVTADWDRNWRAGGVALRAPGTPPALFLCWRRVARDVLNALPNRSGDPSVES